MPFRLDSVGACLKPGTLIDLPEAFLTAQASGPVRLLWGWAKGEQAPLYVVSNMASAEEACRL